VVTVIEHVKHRAHSFEDADPRIAVTNCGRRFVWTTQSDANTRHHQPARSRCAGCWS